MIVETRPPDGLEVAHQDHTCPAIGTGPVEPAGPHPDAWLCATCIDVDTTRPVADHPLTRAEQDRPADTGTGSSPQPSQDWRKQWRWTKQDGEWYLTGPDGEPGRVITVHKRDGSTSEARLISRDGSNQYGDPLWTAERVEHAPQPQPDGQPVERIEPEANRLYVDTAGRIIRVKESRAGRLYGLALDGTDWTYEPGALRNLDRALTLEEAKAYGLRTGICCCCGRTLTNPASIAAGIGPVCASKF